jgi:uncharacterized RDD family membrane protein YckC
VTRWTGSWLSGPGSARDPEDGAEAPKWPGERFGLPAEGPGSVAGKGIRLGALLIDLVVASLVTSVFVRMDVQSPEVMASFNRWAILVWFLVTVVMVSVAGFTAGMALLGIRVARVDGTAMVGPLRAVPRTVLVGVIIPAVIWDPDGRGIHDRLTGTIIIRTR